MSISYLIAFDKKLPKTTFYYKYILESKKTIWGDDDCIIFSDKLFPQEQEIAKNMFPQRVVYSIRPSVSLSYKSSDKDNVSQDYYLCEKEQIKWLIEFLKKHIKSNEDVLFLTIGLGHPIDYSKILSKQIDVNDMILPENEFNFDNYVYQFVNCKHNILD